MAPHLEIILKEIDLLQPADLEVLYLELIKRLHKGNKTIAILHKYAGKGKGVWQTDAQHYIHQLRENDRF
ncbi:MAG: hypothetical protein RLZZ628_306 [Bacteroidota bacterium]|jgi:hypothetical protein